MDQKVGNETQMLEIKTNSTCYNFFLLSTAYLQLVAVNLSDHLCYHQIFAFEQLNLLVRTQFKNTQQLFEAISNSKSRCLQMSQSSKGLLTVNFQNHNALTSIDFQLGLKQPAAQHSAEAEGQSNLKARVVQVCDQNKKLYIENRTLQQQIVDLTNQLRLGKLNFEILEKELKRLQFEFKERNFHERQAEFNVTQLPQKMTFKVPLGSQDYQQEMAQLAKSHSFSFVPFETHFLRNFVIEGRKIRISKGFKDFYQVTSEGAISQAGKTKVSIKVLHTRQTNIYFGVITENRRKEKFTCQHKESISYKLRGGKFLFEDGFQSGEEIAWVKEGETLNLSIDREAKEVSWFIEEKFMIKRRIPTSMEKQQLYVFVSLHDEGDEIEIL